MRVGGLLTAVGLCAALALTGCSAGEPSSDPAPSTPATSSPAPSTSATSSPAPSTSAAGTPEGLAADATTCVVPARLRGQDVERLAVTDKVIALTFDAGANADGVPAIRRVLSQQHVSRATFFLTGHFAATFPTKSRLLARDYLVGNHTQTHPDLTTLTDAQVRAEVRAAEDTIRTRTGQDPRRFFRFPFGARTSHTISVLNGLCYVPFRWTVDTLGWKGTSGGMTAAKVVDRVLAAASPGAIVLMHVGSNPDDGTTLDADALPTVIHELRARGYAFVRLSRVLVAAP